jgi:hypothetical protein
MSPAIIERSKEITFPTLPIQSIPISMSPLSSTLTKPTMSTDLTMTENQSTSELSYDSMVAKSNRNFEIGDCVWIHTLKRTGIVRSLPDHRGNLIVQVKQERITINHKRISIYIIPEEGK